MTPTLSRPSPSSMTASDRRQEAFLLIDEIKAAIAGGASFRSSRENDSKFFVTIRDRLKQFPMSGITPKELEYLRKIAERMKGKRK